MRIIPVIDLKDGQAVHARQGRRDSYAPLVTRFADDAEPNADMWATADESRGSIIDLYHRVWRHSDATIDARGLEAIGEVPWWPESRRQVTLQQILVHMIAETHRHAGQMDIVREIIDGEVGWKPGADNMPDVDDQWWVTYREHLEHVARKFADPSL